jgi:hypothetical protein
MVNALSGEQHWKVGDFTFCSEDCRTEWWNKYRIDSCEFMYRFITSMSVFIVPKNGELGHPNSDVTINVVASSYSISKGDSGKEIVHMIFHPETREFTIGGLVTSLMDQERVAMMVEGMVADIGGATF